MGVASAKRTWTRTLDDRAGISWEEEKRKARLPSVELPVEEYVLADRIDHLIERTEGEQMPEDNPWVSRLLLPNTFITWEKCITSRSGGEP